MTRIARISATLIALAAACPGRAAAPRLPVDTADLLDGDIAAAGAPGQAPANKLSFAPRVQLGYDSNVFQINDDRVSGSAADWIATPGANLQFARTIGRNYVNLAADLGYDFHRRYTGLDQIRVAVNGNGHAALGGVCTADPTAAVRIQQNNVSGLATDIRNSQTVQDYAVTLACQRAVGLYPSVTLTRSTIDNGGSQQALVNQKAEGVEGGIGYALPSLGAILLEYGVQRIRQPNRDDGGSDGSDVTRYAATFTRAVAPRLSFQLGGRYLSVDPRGRTLRRFSGGGYDITIDYHPSPRYALVATATRDVTGSGDVAVAYVIGTTYGLHGTARLSGRARITLGGDYSDQRFRGEDPILYPVPRVRQREASVNTDIRYDLGQAIELGIYGRYARVAAAGDFYDYDRATGGLSIAARF